MDFWVRLEMTVYRIIFSVSFIKKEKSMVIKLKNFYIVVSPFIFLSLLIILLKSNLTNLLICIVALVIHELGHIVIAYLQGEKISILKILPFGFACRFKNQSKITKNKMLKILIAGPAVNIITAVLFFYWTENFAITNLLIGIFNLLPIGELDGMRIFSIVTVKS